MTNDKYHGSHGTLCLSIVLYCIHVYLVTVGKARASPLGQFIVHPETTAKPSRPGHTRRED